MSKVRSVSKDHCCICSAKKMDGVAYLDPDCDCSCHLPVVVEPKRCAQTWRSIRCSKPQDHADAHEFEEDFL